MQKAGGIIALIARIIGVILAFVTLFIGGVGSALKSESAGTVVGLGWGGVLFAFLVIIFGAIAMSAKGKVPSILLAISSIFGIILGGTLVAVPMVLSLIGAILAFIGTKKLQQTNPSVPQQ